MGFNSAFKGLNTYPVYSLWPIQTITGKDVSAHNMKANGGSSGTATFIFNFGTRGR